MDDMLAHEHRISRARDALISAQQRARSLDATPGATPEDIAGAARDLKDAEDYWQAVALPGDTLEPEAPDEEMAALDAEIAELEAALIQKEMNDDDPTAI